MKNQVTWITIFLFTAFQTFCQGGYLEYHSEIIKCEELVVEGEYQKAISRLNSLFNQYEFVFLRDIKVATELSAFEKDTKSGFKFIRLGIMNGWSLPSITTSHNLHLFRQDKQWKDIQFDYDSLRANYLIRIENQIRAHVHEMYKEDQKKALGALLRIGYKGKIKYAENIFAPHSEKQIGELATILIKEGYPGEKLIGNDLWASVILSHHNSISVAYNSGDSLYLRLRPKLIEALENGEMSPYELATIEDWRTAVLNGHELTSYGFLGDIPTNKVLETVNELRARIGLRSTQLRNQLLDVEEKTGINMYLPRDWQKGKIEIGAKQ